MSGALPAPLSQLPLFDAQRLAPEIGVRVSPRSRRLTVRVYPGGRVEVTVPRGTRPAAVERFVSRHRPWIDARVLELATHHRPEQPLPVEVELQALAESWQVRYVRRARPGWRIVSDYNLEVYGDPDATPRARAVLRAWLTHSARAGFEPWLARLAAEHGFEFARLQLRRQQTRWGSCSRTGTISLNVSLLFQPPAVARYLMLHELCHTRHMNHSDRFWKLVAECEPQYRAFDRALTRGWQYVPDWVYG
ncbi:MAG TPA: SprT family zinc-dependent metalloprotease [Steroidobacteraceae bacterium]|nr:SprT family zinc-dependent metalloprotease [Steroidobacteraceae bacterium]